MIERAATDKQLANIFTKATPRVTFEYLRKGIMGWLVLFKRTDRKDEKDYHKQIAKEYKNMQYGKNTISKQT